VELRSVLIQPVDGETDLSPREIAAVLRSQWSLPKGPIESLTSAIEWAGGIVIPFDFETPLVDAVSHWAPPTPPLFFVNSQRPTDRVRFTLAHELGHLMVHQFNRRIFEDVRQALDAEDQANAFASEFLMPEREVFADLRDLDLARLAALKPRWRVSMAALLKKAGDLEAITPRRARRLWAQMSSLGYRRQEPPSVDLAPEPPLFLRKLVELYQARLGYSANEFSRTILAHEDVARESYLLEDSRRLRLVT
jgi:Zn-dependent peptidase ImmA (M78 family)